MAQQATLRAQTRQTKGKGAARSLRRAGLVPGIIYGHHREPEALQIDAPSLGRLLMGAHSSTLVDVMVDDRAPVKALIREIQRDPLRGSDIVHIDLYEVRADEKVAVEVAVHLAQAMRAASEFPAPLDAKLLDVFQPLAVLRGIAVVHPEDALAVADELADAAHVEAGVRAFDLVDVHEVVAQGVRALEIGRKYFARSLGLFRHCRTPRRSSLLRRHA